MKYLMRIKNIHLLRRVTSPVNRGRLETLLDHPRTPRLYSRLIRHINIIRLINNNNNKMSYIDILKKK